MKHTMLTLISLFLISMTYAHPPKSVKLTFDQNEKSLNIDIVHGVKDPTDHFIKEITVTVNDVLIETIKLTKQTNVKSENYIYKIADLKSGDTVKVKGTCVKFGSKSKVITIK